MRGLVVLPIRVVLGSGTRDPVFRLNGDVVSVWTRSRNALGQSRIKGAVREVHALVLEAERANQQFVGSRSGGSLAGVCRHRRGAIALSGVEFVQGRRYKVGEREERGCFAVRYCARACRCWT